MNISEKQGMEQRDPNLNQEEDFSISNDREDQMTSYLMISSST